MPRRGGGERERVSVWRQGRWAGMGFGGRDDGRDGGFGIERGEGKGEWREGKR